MRSHIILACTASLGLSAALYAGVDPANLDRSVKPQDDFFSFANGGWLKTAQIPPEQAMWGAFIELN